MYHSVINRIPVILLLLFLLSSYAYSEQIALNGWEITTDSSETISSMIFRNPETALKTESYFTFTIIDGYKPNKGIITFLNSLKREMTSGGKSGGELRYYWDLCQGYHTVWEYNGSLNRVGTYEPKMNKELNKYINVFCRVETADGNEIFGVIRLNRTRDGIIIPNEDPRKGPISVAFNACRSIQLINRK